MPSLPVSRRRALAGAALLLVALVLFGRHLVRAGAPSSGPSRAAPMELERVAAAPAPQLVVHVVGAVRRPGLYRFREGSRIADAIARAGGVSRRADVAAINLAAPLADGAQVVVPRRGGAGVEAATAGGPSAGGSRVGPVSLSTATLELLDSLPGVGPVTAQKILDYRQQHGAFRSVDELDGVPGIGPARLEELRRVVVP